MEEIEGQATFPFNSQESTLPLFTLAIKFILANYLGVFKESR
jgi:hypothetical protein